MIEQSIGIKIKELRQKLGITQKILCKDICSQSELSKIENVKNIPTSDLLKKFADRLSVDIDYFFLKDEVEIEHIKREFEYYRRLRDYKQIDRLINKIYIKKHNTLIHPYIQNYLIWHQSIVKYHLYNDKNGAITLLNSSLNKLDQPDNELKVEMLNSLGIFLRNEKKFNESLKILEKALSIVKIYPFKNQTRLHLKISHSLSKVYTDVGEIDLSIELCKSSINICMQNEDFYLLAEFHYQMGRNLLLEGKEVLGIKYWKKAVDILKLQENINLVELIENEIKLFKTQKIIN